MMPWRAHFEPNTSKDIMMNQQKDLEISELAERTDQIVQRVPTINREILFQRAGTILGTIALVVIISCAKCEPSFADNLLPGKLLRLECEGDYIHDEDGEGTRHYRQIDTYTIYLDHGMIVKEPDFSRYPNAEINDNWISVTYSHDTRYSSSEHTVFINRITGAYKAGWEHLSSNGEHFVHEHATGNCKEFSGNEKRF